MWRDVNNLLVATGGGAHAQARTIGVTDPSLDAKLTARVTGPGGEDWGVRPVCRIKAQHPVIAAGQGYPGLALRFHATEPVTPDHIRRRRLSPDHVLDRLLAWVAEGKRVMIGGGTATGKTTLLSALLAAVPLAPPLPAQAAKAARGPGSGQKRGMDDGGTGSIDTGNRFGSGPATAPSTSRIGRAGLSGKIRAAPNSSD